MFNFVQLKFILVVEIQFSQQQQQQFSFQLENRLSLSSCDFLLVFRTYFKRIPDQADILHAITKRMRCIGIALQNIFGKKHLK